MKKLLVVLLLMISGCVMGPLQTLSPELQEKRQRLLTTLTDRAPDISMPVVSALRQVPRELFVPARLIQHAYDNEPLPIGEGQTISQPEIVARMTTLLDLPSGARVLEIGTGSGYQAAVLAEMGYEVYSIEIIPLLASSAAAALKTTGYDTVHLKVGDGYLGWPEHAPFDGIILTAAPAEIPQPLLAQLRDGGRLIAPVGVTAQRLVRVARAGQDYIRDELSGVRFVPMTGQAQRVQRNSNGSSR